MKFLKSSSKIELNFGIKIHCKIFHSIGYKKWRKIDFYTEFQGSIQAIILGRKIPKIPRKKRKSQTIWSKFALSKTSKERANEFVKI